MSTMNFIDIASWQKGIDLESVLDKNPDLDGVIVKTTEGIGYMNPCAEEWIKTLQSLGRPFGFYHFLNTVDPEAQADWFVEKSRPWFGEGIPFIDYEADALRCGTEWLKKVLDRVYIKTGVKPIVYCSLSVVQSQSGWDKIANDGYGLWVAQYADSKFTGIVDKPWQSGSVTPFKSYIMHQYSSCGRLSGWNANLDLNKFYGSIDDWMQYAKGEKATDIATPTDPGSKDKKKIGTKVIQRVLDGEYGIGPFRKIRLAKDGYDYDQVQKKINELYAIADKIKMEVGNNANYAELIFKIAFKK